MMHGQFLRPCKIGEQARHRQVGAAEPISSEIGAAVGELGIEPIKLSFEPCATFGCSSRFDVVHPRHEAPCHRPHCGSATCHRSNRGSMASRASSHVEHTDATDDRPECGSCLCDLVSPAGGRRAACGSVPALRRLGRHHHWRLCLTGGMARQRCATETSQRDRSMGPIRRGWRASPSCRRSRPATRASR
jgi:hypothetical protein